MKTIRKAFYFLMAAFMAMEASVLPVRAGEVSDMKSTGYYYLIPGEWRSYHQLRHHMYNDRTAYCIEPRVSTVDGDVYAEEAVEAWTGASASERETILLASAFGEGYPGREGYLWYAAAQDIIWRETGVEMDWADANDEIHKAADEIRASIAAYRAAPDFHITDTVENEEAGSSGSSASLSDGVISRMYKVEDQAGVIASWKSASASGLRVFDENKKEINAADLTTNTFYIRNDAPFQEGSLTFRGISTGSRFTGIPIILYGNENAPEAQKHIVTGNVPARTYTLKMTAVDTPYHPRKTDEDKKGLAGAVLTLSKDGRDLKTWTSDGRAEELRLRMGETYQIRETDAPDGYYCRDFELTVPKADNTDVITDLINDQKIRYEVVKADENGKPVKGAKLALYDITDGSAVLVPVKDRQGNPWITEGKPRDISAYLHVSHTYSIVEEDVSTDYFLAEDTTFTVPVHAPAGNPMITQTITDNHILYRFAKVDEKGKPVEDAELRIYDLDDQNREVYHFTTGTEPTIVGVLERGHRYRLVETKTPQGKYTMAEKEFKVPVYHNAGPLTITGIDFSIVCYADKTDENNQPVAGAVMEVHDVTDGGDRITQTFISSGQPQLLEGMCAGHSYVLRETAAPEGYYLAEDVPFVIPVHGTDEPVHVRAVDHPIALSICKTDPDGNLLAGITLEVLEKKTGKSLGTWQTQPEKTIEIGSLVQAGGEYILREKETVDGYYFHKDVTFSIPEHYNAETNISVTMQDEPVRLQVIKEDESGNMLAGAHITLEEKVSDEIIHEWDTVTEAHDISAYVHPEKTYVLRETEIVNGHYQAVEQEFEVPRYPGKDNPLITLKMVDETIRYEITKTDEKGNPVKGVHLKITDKETGEVKAEWDTDEAMHELSGILDAGHAYLLEETEWVNGVIQAQDLQFTVPVHGTSQSIRIEMVDETLAMAFLKTDETGKPLAGAELSILDAAGNEVCRLTSNDDPRGVSQTSEGIDISTLLKGGSQYILHENKAPFGYETAADVVFTATGTLARPQVISMTDRICDVWVHLVKMDGADPRKKLADAEFAVYRKADHSIAIDCEGNKAVKRTDAEGNAWFHLPYDANGYYVKETKAPEGYQQRSENMEVKITAEKGLAKDSPVVMQVLNEQEVNTGVRTDWEIMAMAGFLIAAVILSLVHHKQHS